jgi:hypothetical protein
MRHLPLSHVFAGWMHSKARSGSCNFGTIMHSSEEAGLWCSAREGPRFINSASHLKPLLILLRPRTNLF